MQPSSHLVPGDGVDPVEVAGKVPGFVALNGADEVPDGIAVSQSRYLVDGFLHIVFPEVALPGVQRGADGGNPFGFRYREQLDIGRVPVRRNGGVCDLFPDTGQIFGDGSVCQSLSVQVPTSGAKRVSVSAAPAEERGESVT